MASTVNTSPYLPRPVSTGDTRSIQTFLTSLVTALVTEFTQHAVRLNNAFTKDGKETMTAPAFLASYTVATVPAATTAAGLIYVTDETGGAVPAFSDGTNWRRVTDRAIVS